MRDKKETLDKENKKLKFKKIAKKQIIQEQGITLIALVVTIIILLILAGVTLNIALSDNGLFSKAKKAAEEYEQAQSEEEDLISQFATQMYSEYVGATVTGYDLSQNKKTVTITSEQSGINQTDTVDSDGNEIQKDDDGNQTFETEKMTWRVWDFDGNILRIIGNPTSQKLALKGAAGYNNGVWAINEICEKLYSNGKDGVSATSLKRTDIQKVSTYDYTQYKHELSGWKEVLGTDPENTIQFGESRTYDINHSKYPKVWETHDKNWSYVYNDGEGGNGKDKECETWEESENNQIQIDSKMSSGDTSANFKQSTYSHQYIANDFINSSYFELINSLSNEMKSMQYWLGGRCVDVQDGMCLFDIQYIYPTSAYSLISGHSLCRSNRSN